MQRIDENLAVLHRRDPNLATRLATCDPSASIETVSGTSGAPTLRVNGALEASAVDAEAEGREQARRLIERAAAAGATRLVVFGIGVHTLRFLDAFDGDVLVVEPSLDVCRRVLECVDLTAALERIDLVVSDDPAPALAHRTFRSDARGLFLAHAATRRRAAELHDQLARRFAPGGAPAALDVAVVPPLHGGSLPVAQACANALRQLGHSVRDHDLSAFLPAYETISGETGDPRLRQAGAGLRGSLVRLIGELLVATYRLDPPDVVFALAQAPLDPQVLAELRRLGITTAMWFCEDFHVMPYWRDLAGAYDTFFHVQPDDFSEPLRAAGAYGVPLRLGFDPEVHRPLDPAPRLRHPLSFVGAGYHNRREFLPGLIDQGLAVYGTEWPLAPPLDDLMPEPNVRLSSEDSNRIFNESAINLNLHSSPWCDGVNPVGDYLNPRTFELAGAQAFQLCDWRSDLARAFEPGHEIETFRDLEECRAKIAHYAEHEQERSEIAKAGHRRALREHTYRHRMLEAFDALRAGPVPLARRPRGAPSVAAVLAEARDEPGLARVLERLEADRKLDADALASAIASGEGPLSHEEGLLLFMREYLRDVREHGDLGAAG